MSDTYSNDASNGAFDDELLSAYVDGELSDDQHAQVEQHLHDNPAARQLVDELSRLSATIQALPREPVSEGLKEAVLQRAEVTGNLASGHTRRWGWAVMALAAALMLMIYQPEAENEGQPLAAVDAERDQDQRSEPEFEAPAPMPAEIVAPEEESAFADSVPALNAAVVEEALVLGQALAKTAVPIREVHVVLNRDLLDLEKTLALHGITQVSELGDADVNRKRSSLGRNAPGGAAGGRVAKAEEMLVEGTTEQIEKMLLALQSTSTRSGASNSFGLLAKEAMVDALAIPQEKNKFFEGIQSNEALPAKPGTKLEADSAESEAVAGVRIRVRLYLHPAPESAKPATTNKKARSSVPVGGKEG